jgi:hypothetical protein
MDAEGPRLGTDPAGSGAPPKVGRPLHFVPDSRFEAAGRPANDLLVLERAGVGGGGLFERRWSCGGDRVAAGGGRIGRWVIALLDIFFLRLGPDPCL